ncbi:MAG: type II toxin-antitoxin system VapC family toxin [Candidatus Asgardarchaeum sp.]
MIVIDASALSKYVLKEPGWSSIEKYLYEAYSLDFALIESANAIWKAYYMNLISEKDAIKKLEALKIIFSKVLTVIDSSKFIGDAFSFAIENRTPIYDMLYIALAKQQNLPLLTSDNKQARIARKYDIEVIEV